MFISKRLFAAVALWGMATAAFALPEIKVANNVEYMTGGIGLDESTEMRAQSRRWPLALEFSVKAGGQAQWMANVDVSVTDHYGRTVLQATSDGPILLARIPSGNYTVRASAAGKVLERKVHIAPGESARAVFVWTRVTEVG